MPGVRWTRLSESGAEAAGAQVGYEGFVYYVAESPTLRGGEVLEVGGEAGACLVRGHGVLRAARRSPRRLPGAGSGLLLYTAGEHLTTLDDAARWRGETRPGHYSLTIYRLSAGGSTGRSRLMRV